MDAKKLIMELIEKEIKPITFRHSSMIKEIICEYLVYEHKINACWSGLTIYIDNKPVCIIRTGKEKLQKGEGHIFYFDSVKWL